VSRLSDLYNKQIRNEMQEKFGYTNVMDIPKLEKIVINIGVGEATENTKTVDAAASDLEAITGQKPIVKLTSPSQHGRFVKECHSVARSLSEAKECMNSSTV
jgi:ribosomal protein L5